MSEVQTNIDFTENRQGDQLESAIITSSQEITPEFLRQQKQLREMSSRGPAGEYHEVCAIPQILVDRWKKEGFDVFTESAKSIVAKLKVEGFEYFMSTTKKL